MQHNPNKNYKYYAFISYKREDEKWAKWLQNRLMHYKLPTNIRKVNPKLPVNVHPVFRDTTDLNGGILANVITEALDSSRYLIVICSPRAAQSKWVCKEVQHFIDTGREKYIIPFIVEGVPNSNDIATECFPEALRTLAGSRELLGININEMGRDAAAIKVVSRMFDLQFDSLWQRWERYQRRHRWLIIFSSITIALIAISVGIYIAWQNQEIQVVNYTLDVTNKELDKINQTLYTKSVELQSTNELLDTRNTELKVANTNLDEANDKLHDANKYLKTTNQRLNKANHQMQINLARFVSEKAMQLIEEGNAALAQRLLIKVLPNNMPHTIEAESALRHSYSNYSMQIKEESNAVILDYIPSPNENLLAVALNNGMVKIFDMKTGTHVATLLGHEGAVWSVDFNNSGDLLLTASSDNTIKIWDVASKQCIKTLYGHTDMVRSAVYSSDNKMIVSASSDGTVRLWGDANLMIGSRLVDNATRMGDNEKYVCNAVYRHDDGVNLATFSKDGNYIVSASKDGSIKMWSTKTGGIINQIKQETAFNSVAFSPDDKYLVSVDDENVKIWECNTFTCLHNISVDNEVLSRISFYDNKYFCIPPFSMNADLILYDVTNGLEYKRFPNKSYGYTNIRFANISDYMILESGNILNIKKIKNQLSVQSIKAHSSTIRYLALDNTGEYLASCSDDNSTKIWKLSTDDCVLVLDDYNTIDAVENMVSSYDKNNFAFSPNGEYLYIPIDSNCKFVVYDFANNKYIEFVNNTNVTASCFTPCGQYIITGDEYGQVKVWDIYSGNCIYSKQIFTSGICMLNVDERYLVCASYEMCKLLSYPDLECVNCYRNEDELSFMFCITPYNKTNIFTGAIDCIKMIDLRNSKVIREFTCKFGGFIDSISVSENEKYLIASFSNAMSTSIIKVWDIESGINVATFEEDSQVRCVFMSNSCRDIIVSTDDGDIKYYQFKPIEELIVETQERIKSSPLTPEECRKYYVE